MHKLITNRREQRGGVRTWANVGCARSGRQEDNVRCAVWTAALADIAGLGTKGDGINLRAVCGKQPYRFSSLVQLEIDVQIGLSGAVLIWLIVCPHQQITFRR